MPELTFRAFFTDVQINVRADGLNISIVKTCLQQRAKKFGKDFKLADLIFYTLDKNLLNWNFKKKEV